MDAAKSKMDAAFEFFTKLGTPYYCFHDTDVVGDGSVFEIETRMTAMLGYAKQKQADSGVNVSFPFLGLSKNRLFSFS